MTKRQNMNRKTSKQPDWQKIELIESRKFITALERLVKALKWKIRHLETILPPEIKAKEEERRRERIRRLICAGFRKGWSRPERSAAKP